MKYNVNVAVSAHTSTSARAHTHREKVSVPRCEDIALVDRATAACECPRGVIVSRTIRQKTLNVTMMTVVSGRERKREKERCRERRCWRHVFVSVEPFGF